MPFRKLVLYLTRVYVVQIIIILDDKLLNRFVLYNIPLKESGLYNEARRTMRFSFGLSSCRTKDRQTKNSLFDRMS